MHIHRAEDGLDPAAAEAKFKELFTAYHKQLRFYAFTMVKDEAAAEEIVQDVFCRLWEHNGKIHLEKANQAYLYKAVYNESVNVLKKNKLRAKHAAGLSSAGTTETATELRALQEKATEALNGLPEQCRTIFQMSRFEEMKYREIADQLGISVKTVEAQMSKALRIMRTKLADYLPVLWLCIMGLKK